jgi:hypothetical protein
MKEIGVKILKEMRIIGIIKLRRETVAGNNYSHYSNFF